MKGWGSVRGEAGGEREGGKRGFSFNLTNIENQYEFFYQDKI